MRNKNRQQKISLNKNYVIETGGKSKDGKQIAGEQTSFIANDDMEYAVGNKIPLLHLDFCIELKHLLY